MKRPLVLLVEDEAGIAEMLALNLRHEGFEVVWAASAEEAEARLLDLSPTLILLDWMLPGVSGIELLRRWRGRPSSRQWPVILLTARSDEADRVQGLDVGADDYVAKPFSVKELMARIRAVLRRRLPEEAQQTVQVGDLRLDPRNRWASHADQPIKLGPTEFRMLQVLMGRPGQVFSRSQLLDRVWGEQSVVEDRTVDAVVKRLRQSLEAAGARDCIETLRGAGYRLLSTTTIAPVAAPDESIGSGTP